MSLSTTFLLVTMTETTYAVRVQQLITEVENHPHKAELIALALDQLADDTYKVQQS
jgi:hypothetical protein